MGTTQEKGFSTGGGDLWVPQQRRGTCMVLVPVGRDLWVHTTAEKGYGVSTSGGRPVGTTAVKGYGVSQGRSVGTTQEKGFSTGGERPVGTTAEKGYGTGERRLPDYKVGKHIEFRAIDLPDKWDTSKDKLTLHLTYWNGVPNVLCNRDV